MLLKEKLGEYTKQELLDQARSFDLRKCSGLNKNQLIDKIATFFCSEEILRNRLACLPKEQIDLYRKACISPIAIPVNEAANAIQLHLYWLGYFEDPSDDLCIYEDVAAVFQRIDDEDFKEDNRKKGWLMKCLFFFRDYYGIAPLEVIYEMYQQKTKCTLDEMKELFMEMPIDIVDSCIFSMDLLGMNDCPVDSPLYTENGLLVFLPLFHNDELGYLLHQQADKDFFVPSVNIIDEICRCVYEVSAPAYRKLETFIIKKLGQNYEQAVNWCMQIWANSYNGNSLSDIMNLMAELKINFDSDSTVNEFLKLLMNAHNSTRLKENRGHNPNELRKNIFKNGMPTIVPGSSHAAAMLEEAEPQLRAMGFPIDISGGADTISTSYYPIGLNGKAVKTETKIYPNDLCPCGSGKKYKKCCGKFRQE